MTARVMLGVPHRLGEVHIAFTRSLLQLNTRGVELGMIDHSHTDVVTNRNVIVQRVLDHPNRATHLFFVDTDMGIPRDALQKLLAADKSLISGLAVEKVSNRIVAMEWGDGFGSSIALQQTWCEPGTWLLRDEYKERVLPIGATGTACLLIKREVLETIPYPWFFHEFDPAATSHTPKSYMGSDISFFHKAKQHGIEAFMHTGVLCDHWLGTSKFPPHWGQTR
jgi:hypothetical protein